MNVVKCCINFADIGAVFLITCNTVCFMFILSLTVSARPVWTCRASWSVQTVLKAMKVADVRGKTKLYILNILLISGHCRGVKVYCCCLWCQ